MEQYDKNEPTTKRPGSGSVDKTESLLQKLQSRIAEQDRAIENLQKDVRRLKGKIDRHADHLNQQDRG